MPKIAVVLAVLAMPYIAVVHRRELGAIIRDALALARTPAIAILIASFMWAILSSLWSLNPLYGLQGSIRALLTLLPLLVIAATARRDSTDRDRLALYTLGGMGIAAVVTILAAPNAGLAGQLLGYPLADSHFNRVAVSLCMLLPAAILALWHWRMAATLLFALVVIACFRSYSESSKLGLLAGVLMFALAVWLPRVSGVAWITGVLATTLFLPVTITLLDWALGPVLSELLRAAHAAERLEIWRQYIILIPVKPLFGWGLESGRYLLWDGEWNAPPELQITSYAPFHSHNIFLQIWFEQGVIGALLATGALIAAYRVVRRLPRVERAFGLALLVTFVAIGSVSYGAWQYWWIALIGLAAIGLAKTIQSNGTAAAAGQDAGSDPRVAR